MADIFKVIFQLEADGQGVLKEINAVASQYKKVNTELKKQEQELNALLKKEAEILAIRKKTNSPSEAAKLTKQLQDNKKAIDALKKSTEDLTKAEKDVVKESETISKKLDNAFKGTQVKSLRTQLKELKAQLATTDDDEEFLKLSVEAGKLEDKIQDASDAARIFATDSPFEAVGNAIGSVGSKLLNLDFEGAAKSSQLLVQASSKITFGNALTGIKQLGQTLFNVGKALLTNPLFLIGAAVVAIIANFDKLKNSGGLIGTVFKGIGDIITGAIDLFFSLTDAIGLTEHALSNLNESIRENAKLLLEQQQKVADRQIAIAKAAGVATEKLEKEQARKSIALLGLQLETYKKAGKLREDLTDEERKNAIELANEILDQGNKIKEIEAASNKKRIDNAKKYKEDASKVFSDLTKKLIDEQTKQSEFNAKVQFGEGSVEQIQATFEIRKKLEAAQFKEIEKESLKELKSKADREKAKLLLVQIRTQQEKNLENDLSFAKIEAQKTNTQAAIEREKANNELLIEQAGGTETEIAEKKLLVQQNYYKKSIKLAEDDIARRKDKKFDTTAQEKALSDLKLKAKTEEAKSFEELNKLTTDAALKQNATLEEQSDVQLQLQNARNSTQLFNQLKFEQDKLAILEAAGEKYAEEYKKQQDKIALLTKEATKQKKLEEISYFEQIIGAAISATNKIIDAKIKEVDKQTELQQKRVDEAKEIASEGNAELLQEEKSRLEKLTKEKEKFVRQQQALATIELVANTAIAISKAAAQGGVAAGITIAAALLALVAGLASARSIASQAAFYEGGLYEGEGYTGSGNPKGESSKVGRKPYIYHNDEFIFNHKKTRKYKDIFQGVHEGRIDLRDWADKVRAFDSYNFGKETKQLSPIVHTSVEISELKGQMETLINIVKNQSTSVNMDDNGFALHLKKVVTRNEFIRNMAK